MFSKAFLIDSLWSSETVYDKVIDTSRWSIHHERVFKYDGKLYKTFYSRGSTESQDESPYEYENVEIECDEVFAVEKTVTVYVSLNELDKVAKTV